MAGFWKAIKRIIEKPLNLAEAAERGDIESGIRAQRKPRRNRTNPVGE